MKTKTTGKELKAFWDAGLPWWPEDAFVDGDEYDVNGQLIGGTFEPLLAEDTDKITILDGYVYESASDDEGKDLQLVFRKWRKAQTHVQVIVEIHRDELPAFEREMKSYGAKIIK